MVRKLADTIHLRLRFDERLRRRIEKAAEQNNQSMNAEIIARLEQSFSKEDVNEVIAKTAEAAVRQLDGRLAELAAGARRMGWSAAELMNVELGELAPPPDTAEIGRRRQASIAATEGDPISELRKAIGRLEDAQPAKPAQGTDVKHKGRKEG